jgi:hypothetical protein
MIIYLDLVHLDINEDRETTQLNPKMIYEDKVLGELVILVLNFALSLESLESFSRQWIFS